MSVKARINLAVNILSYSLFVVLVATGTVLKWILPPGSGRAAVSGRSGGGRNIDLVFGLTRHEWGDIHFWIAAVFFFSISMHLFLHWPWIRAMVWGVPGKPLPRRTRFLTIGICAATAVVLCLPWFVSKHRLSRAELRSQRMVPLGK